MAPAVAVAVSGGRDSTALLHATAHAAAALGLQVHALHVHHGLLPEADDWLRRVRAQCRRWAVAGLPVHFHVTRLTDRPAAGDSIEAWARRARYRALAAMAQHAGCSLVLLAHHRRDQAETLLLQALRGGGPAGLSAMPRSAQRQGLTWARPWLALPREAIEAYVRRHRLGFVDDTSNVDTRFARNRLRAAVWPALVDAFPDAETQLQAAAQRAQETAACLQELVLADREAAADGAALAITRWRLLSAARRTLLLRHWLPAGAPESLVQRLAGELPGARSARWPAPGGELQLHDGLLRFEPTAAARQGRPADQIDLSRPGLHAATGWGGAFVVAPACSGGVEPSRLHKLQLRSREGGERFQAAANSPPRSLKKQFQSARVPAWQRDGPLLYAGDSLLFVPGLGLDARQLAQAGTPQLVVRWQPQTPG